MTATLEETKKLADDLTIKRAIAENTRQDGTCLLWLGRWRFGRPELRIKLSDGWHTCNPKKLWAILNDAADPGTRFDNISTCGKRNCIAPEHAVILGQYEPEE
jgi:hypothetical protein